MNKFITSLIEQFVKDYHGMNYTKTQWKDPLVAYADVSDPLFLDLKRIIDPSHRLPGELLKGAKIVISYFIPFEEEVVRSNVKSGSASREWAIAYLETNKLIMDLNQYLIRGLQKMGDKVVSIAPTHIFDEKELISNWSHKHIAYIAGLGNFGIHKMLITEKGCCGRLGSVITTLALSTTMRTEKPYCLYYYNKSCKQCVEKCTFNALRMNDYDRKKCYDMCLENAHLYSSLGLADVCGKCVSMVPCSHSNPVKSKK